MPRFVAFLRAINLGGARTVKMDFLRQLFESLDFSAVETFIASGNVVFKTRTKSSEALERKIEKRLREVLGYDVDVFIRTNRQLVEIGDYNSFLREKIDAHTACNIVFLKNIADEKVAQKLRALGSATDKFCIRGREILLGAPQKTGRSLLYNSAREDSWPAINRSRIQHCQKDAGKILFCRSA